MNDHRKNIEKSAIFHALLARTSLYALEAALKELSVAQKAVTGERAGPWLQMIENHCIACLKNTPIQGVAMENEAEPIAMVIEYMRGVFEEHRRSTD